MNDQTPSKLRWVLLPIVVALVIRLAIVWAQPDMDLHGDEKDFVKGAQQLVAGEEVTFFPFRPPLYIGFCGAVLAVTGPEQIDSLRVAQILTEALTILGIVLLGRATVGARAGLIAAWLYALYPDAVAYSHYLWSETLSSAVLIWALLSLVALRRRGTLGMALVNGLLWGALALIKPHNIYVLPLLLAYLVWENGRPARARMVRACLATFVVAILTVLPWSVSVSQDEGEPIFICTTGKLNLKTGVNFLPPPQTDFATAWHSTQGQRSNPDNQRDVGVASFILSNPGLFLERAVLKMSYLWSPNSFVLRNIYDGGKRGKQPKYGRPKNMVPALRWAVVYGTLLSTMVLTIGLILGGFSSRCRTLAGLTAVYCFAYMAMITLTPALSRYRLPMMLFAVLHTGALLAGDGWRTRLSQPASTLGAKLRGKLGAGLCLGALMILWVLRLPDIIEAVW